MMLMRPISYISIKPDSPDLFRVNDENHVWQLGSWVSHRVSRKNRDDKNRDDSNA